MAAAVAVVLRRKESVQQGDNVLETFTTHDTGQGNKWERVICVLCASCPDFQSLVPHLKTSE